MYILVNYKPKVNYQLGYYIINYLSCDKQYKTPACLNPEEAVTLWMAKLLLDLKQKISEKQQIKNKTLDDDDDDDDDDDVEEEEDDN